MTSVTTALPAWASSNLVKYGVPGVAIMFAIILAVYVWKLMNRVEKMFGGKG